MAGLPILRGYNYFYFSLLAIFISFLPVYLSAQGISPAKIGLAIGAGTFIGIFSQPLWGMISDRFKTIKKIILLLLIVSIVIGTLLFQTVQYTPLLLLIGLLYFFFLPADPLTESLNFRVAEEKQISFGSIRLFGSIGYAVTSLGVGYFADLWGMSSLAWLFASFGFITLLLCLLLPDAPASSTPVSTANLKQFFVPHTIWFFLLILTISIPHRTNDSFLGVFIQSLGGSSSQVGQAWFFTSISEVVAFALSFWWLRKGNELQLMTGAAAIYFVRFAICAVVTNPQWIVYLQLLQGLTFGVFYVASIQYLYKIAPKEWKATGQTILAVVFFGISGIIGSIIGGWIFERVDGSFLYLVMALCSLFSLVLFLITIFGSAKSPHFFRADENIQDGGNEKEN